MLLRTVIQDDNFTFCGNMERKDVNQKREESILHTNNNTFVASSIIYRKKPKSDS